MGKRVSGARSRPNVYRKMIRYRIALGPDGAERAVSARAVEIPNLRQSLDLLATVRVCFVLGGKRVHGRLDGPSALPNVPAIATRVNRARSDR
jgi:hypothetical protein